MVRNNSIQDKFNFRIEKIKNSLRHQKWHEFLIFFCFFLLSAGFWVLQSLKQDYEIELNIPVKYKGVSSHTLFTTDPPKQIEVFVKDKGSVLLNYVMGRTFVPIEIPFEINEDGAGLLKISNKELVNSIKKQLLNSTSIVSIMPSDLAIASIPQYSKIVPVQFSGTIQLKAGYQLQDSVTITPSSIKVYAAQELLDTLNCVYTKFEEIESLKNNFSTTIPLLPLAGVSMLPSEIDLSFSAEEYVEKTLQVKVSHKNLPQGIKLKTFPSAIQVMCSIPLSQFKELTDEQLEITLDYTALETHVNRLIPVSITQKPAWVNVLKLSPEKLEFIIEKIATND
jgi:YbbR domain-containing protein